MISVMHQGRPAAFVTRGETRFAAAVECLERDHPTRRWVACTAFFALDVLSGRIRGPYTQRRADHFARCALLPDEDFLPIAGHADALLAEHFNVPLEQVGEKRADLRALALLEL